MRAGVARRMTPPSPSLRSRDTTRVNVVDMCFGPVPATIPSGLSEIMANTGVVRGTLIVMVGVVILLTALGYASFGANGRAINLATALAGAGLAVLGLIWIWRAGGFSSENR